MKLDCLIFIYYTELHYTAKSYITNNKIYIYIQKKKKIKSVVIFYTITEPRIVQV